MEQINHQASGTRELSEKERDVALSKYYIIQPFLQNSKKLAAISNEHNLSIRTLKRWVTNYYKKGLLGLARVPRKDKDNRRCSIELQHFIEGFYLQSPHLSRASIYRKISTSQFNNECPSYRTVCSIIAQIPTSMTVLAHDGTKSYKQQFDLLCMHQASRANQIWQADHMLLDIFIKQDTNKESSARPWLTIIIDDHSRAIAGYELSFLSPSAIKTSLALRQAIWRKQESQWSICGIPNTLYTDHGSDFTSKHIEQVCIDLKIELIFSNIGEPRGRGKIERFFRTLNQLLLSELTGYTQNKNPTAKYTLAELNSFIRSFIIEYNQREHPTIKATPKECWESSGFIPHMPDSIDQLDLLLLTLAKSRMVRRDGIHFQGLRYIDPILADYVGESVIIRYDPTDITSIRVFYKNRYLCQPICQALDEQSVNLKDIQSARNKRRKNLHRQIDQRLSLVDAILGSKTAPNNTENTLDKIVKKPQLKLYKNDE